MTLYEEMKPIEHDLLHPICVFLSPVVHMQTL